jgi:hypothetical protein
MKGDVKVTRPTGAVLTGEFTSVDITTFSRAYSQTFGRVWSSSTAGQFQGSGMLSGEGVAIQCFYVGSMRTNNGYGQCKSNEGKEYNLQF